MVEAVATNLISFNCKYAEFYNAERMKTKEIKSSELHENICKKY